MYFTSGSTGQPKAVMVSHRANWLRAFLAANVVSAGGMVCMFPLFHIAGWQVLAQSWARRRAVHLVQRADADLLLGAVDRWGASTLYAIPAVWKRILECGTSYDLSSLRGVDAGTSYVGSELIVALRARFPGTHNMLGYGSTEMGAGLQIAHEDILRKPGSVGLPCPGVSAKLVDGELYLRGATMMEGYFKLPAETAEAIADGWYRTGDLAERDDDGYYTIIGRRKEIIRSGGETISPVELDALLKRIEGVADVAAIGLPDADWGEIVCVAVVRRPDCPLPTLSRIRQQLGDVSSYKLPRAFREVSFIPRTQATGQVQRNQLREMILAAPATD
jgi:acyl-CoA synthetase (AMP-forming)/AMP-acid ligase II